MLCLRDTIVNFIVLSVHRLSVFKKKRASVEWRGIRYNVNFTFTTPV